MNISQNHCSIAPRISFALRHGLLGLLLTCIQLVPNDIRAQDSVAILDLDTEQIDIADVIRDALGKEPKEKPSDAVSLILVPIIGSNPATGFMVGLGGQYAFKMKKSTRYSTLSGSAQVTTKGQLLFLLSGLFTIHLWFRD
mgnify:FL=1